MSRRRVTALLVSILTFAGALTALLWPGPAPVPPIAPNEAEWVRAASTSLGLDLEVERDVIRRAGPALARVRAVVDSIQRADLLEVEMSRLAITVVQEADGPIPILEPTTICLRYVGAPAPESFVAALAAPSEALGVPIEPDCARALITVDPTEELLASHGAEIRALTSGAVPITLITFGSPEAVEGLPQTDALLVTHSTSDASAQAAADAIRGRIPVSGRLTADVRGMYRVGAGVDLTQQALREDSPEAAGLAPDIVAAIDAVLARGLARGAFPGASVAVGRGGVLIRLKGYGDLTADGPPATVDTPYDLASLTKVVSTTSLAMRAVERGDIELDSPVRDLVPTYRPIGGDAITPRHLLTHTAGHRPFWPFYYYGMTPEAARAFIHADTLQRAPGERIVYSDFDMIVLGEALEAASGESLDVLTKREITGPLGMRDTEFRAVGSRDLLAAPTERDTTWRMRLLQGEVHDEAASLFGGVSGHAGLFSTARDMARFGFALANRGEAYGYRLASGETLDQFTRTGATPGSHAMGLGWMLAPRGRGAAEPMGRRMGPRTFGHTGFTGTSIWVDPEEDLFIVLLTNRVHPSRSRRGIREVRAELADAVASRITAPVR